MMRAGTDTGSLMNHLHSREVGVVPTVGMGATLLCWTDRHPATVIFYDGKILKVQEDNAVRVDKNGMSESQQYEYTPNPNGGISIFKKNKNGQFDQVRLNEETGRYNKVSNGGVRVGVREKYHDFCF